MPADLIITNLKDLQDVSLPTSGYLYFNGLNITSSPISISSSGNTISNVIPVDVATISTLPNYTYNNGIITGISTGVVTVDSQQIDVGNIILVKNEVGLNAPYNGVYICTNNGVSSHYILVRSPLMNSSLQFIGSIISVSSLSGRGLNNNTLWQCNISNEINSGINVGVDSVAFIELVPQTSITNIGNTIYVDAVNGNDSTAKRGRLDLPFLTPTAATLANGIKAGDIIKINPGLYDITALSGYGSLVGQLRLPNGVSLNGAGSSNTIIKSTINLNNAIINPGTNCNINSLQILGNLTPNLYTLPIGASPYNGDIFGTNIVVSDIVTNSWSDGFYWNNSGSVTNWRFNNCQFNSNYDTAQIMCSNNVNSFEFYNCEFNPSGNGPTAQATLRGMAIKGGKVKLFGGYINSIALSGYNSCGVYIEDNSNSSIDIFGTKITVLGSGPSGNCSLFGQSGTIWNIGPGTSYDTSLVHGGTFASVGSPAVPLSNSPITNPISGVLGSLAYYNGNLYYCSNSAIPTWNLLSLSSSGYLPISGGNLTGPLYINNNFVENTFNKNQSSGYLGLDINGNVSNVNIQQLTNIDSNLSSLVLLNGQIGIPTDQNYSYIRLGDGVTTGGNVFNKGGIIVANYVTISPLPAYTYYNGTNGVGATLTASSNGILTIDGHATVLGNIILVREESFQNGVYIVTTAGTSSVPYVLTRITEMNSTFQFIGTIIYIISGNSFANTQWVCNNSSLSTGVTVGSTSISFIESAYPINGGLLSGPITLASSNKLSWPNGYIVCDSAGNLTIQANSTISFITGTLEFPTVLELSLGSRSAPNVSPGTGAGSGGTATLSSVKFDSAGTITIVTGTGPASNALICTLTYGYGFSSFSSVILTPASATAAALNGNSQVYISSSSSSSFAISIGSTNLSSSTTYIWNYIVIGD